MRTRSGATLKNTCTQQNNFIPKRSRDVFAGEQKGGRKRRKFSPLLFGGADFFDALPDDVVLFILSKLSASASCPADLINVLITCKKLNTLGLNPVVLSKANRKVFAFKAEKWSESAHRFLKLSADTGNIEAFYTLGMIRFYCFQNRSSGASLMAKAAINSHAPALYSLSVIQFNGSGGSKNDKDLRAGVALCARAAFLGHIDALRELGHCFQDGYGVKQNVVEGRRFLVQANALEIAAVLSAYPSAAVISAPPVNHHHHVTVTCPLSVFGSNLPDLEAHPVHRFLTEWFAGRGSNIIGSDLRLCGNSGCGRPETRRHEFRRCSVCGAVNYCSRACQSFDWKIRHKVECTPTERWVEEIGEIEAIANGGGEADGGIGNGDDAMMLES